MDVNDKYLLEITSSAKGINKVAGDLDKLKASLKGFTFSPAKANTFTTFSNSITAFGKAVSNIETGKIMAFSTAMKQLGDVKIKLPSGMDKAVKEIEKAFTGLGDSKELYKKVNSFSRIMQPLSDLKFGGVKGAGDAVKGLEKALDSLDFRKIHGEADALNRTLAPLASTMEKLSSASVNLGFNKSFGKGIGNAYQGLQDVLSGSAKKSGSTKGAEEDTKSLGDRFGELKSKAQVAFTAIVQGAKRVASAMKSIASVVGKVVVAISNIGFLNPFRGVAESVTNVIKKLKTLWSSLARIAMYRALRSAIKEIAKAVREGLTNLYYWSQATGGDFAPAVDRLATAFLYLKNSIGASISPLITYFAPAIDMAVDKVVQFINVINQLFARLTGRGTWTEALRYPTEFAERASGATKKVKDNIQDFDELHILRTDNGGGGASGMDYNNMFRESEFTQGLTEWIEDFKNEIRRGRWYEAGEILAEQINGVIDRINWGRLGTRFASKVNDMIHFAFGVAHNIDFVNIGSSIATFLNNAIETLDTNTLGRLLAHEWMMIFDTAYGFVSTFDFPQFGWRVSELVQGWFEEIDGARIGTTISDAIKGALDSAIAFLSNQSMLDSFVEDVAGIINNIDWYGIFCRVLTIATQIANALADVINSVLDGNGRQSSSGGGLNVDRLNASAPPAIAQRVQAEYAYNVSRGHTGTFGEQIVQGMTDSVVSADTSALIDAIENLVKAVWRAVKSTIGEIIQEGATELMSRAIGDLSLLPYIDRDGNMYGSYQEYLRLQNSNQSQSSSVGSRPSPRSSSSSSSSSSRPRSSSSRSSTVVDSWVSGVEQFASTFSAFGSVVLGAVTKNSARADKNLTSMDKTMRTLNTDTNKFGATIGTVNAGVKDFSTESVEGVRSVQSSFETFGAKIGGEVVNRVMDSKSAITSAFASMKDEASNSLGSLANNAVASMQNTASAVTAPLQGIKDNIVSAFRTAGDESVASIGDLSSRMSNSLGGLVEASRQQMEGYTSKWNELHSATRGVSNSVIGGAERMANAVIDAFNSLQDATGNIKIDVPGYKFEAHNLRRLTHISIPQLATGGIATSPTTALIGEAGREAVLPLENNTSWMDTLADRINGDGGEEVALLREQNDLLRQIAVKNVTISSRDVFNAVRDENSDYITRTGKNALAFS